MGEKQSPQSAALSEALAFLYRAMSENGVDPSDRADDLVVILPGRDLYSLWGYVGCKVPDDHPPMLWRRIGFNGTWEPSCAWVKCHELVRA